jgi:SAM-dependent methyltransferase
MWLRRTRGWKVRSDPLHGRRHALAEEAGYWRDWIRNRGGRWRADFEYRFDREAEVDDPLLRGVLGETGAAGVSILDVGAGPVSFVGQRYEGVPLKVVAVDPLADKYNRLLDSAGLEPPVRTEQVAGERLLERFGAEKFDITYARNALDHAIDPVVIIEQMITVVRPGGYVVLRHRTNEAEQQGYIQLHQWNFDAREGELIVWRPSHETNVSARLAGRADVTCHREATNAEAEPDEADPGWCVCVIRKLGG